MTFNEVQWDSKAFKEAQRLQGVQRGSKDPEEAREILSEESRVRGLEKLRVKHGVAEMPHRNKKNTQNGEDRNWGVAEMQHSFFVAQQCVSPRHSKTQYLVWKKTNNFNDLTVKNRLTAVVKPLDIVAWSD